MGEMVEFASNGTTGQGYLALPESGSGPGVVVIQEWWGLNQQIKEVCDRLADDGFVALAPDLYRGKATTQMDEAGQLMMSLNIEQAAKDMAGAVDYLKAHGATTGAGVGVTGFCMGGGLALWLATLRPDDVKAAVPFYGLIPWPAAQPDYSRLGAPVLGHYAENDDFASPESARELEAQLKGLGKEVELHIYPGVEHGFTNHHRPDVFHEEHSDAAWDRTVAFFREHLA
jgi:carboxymethylenebutenolidase